ncbi:hypothetical protein GCM10011378_08020 [Hymenobacter glacieicola]|uniref:Uncharacterized protein n=1 Tax=Hymenobacter glacieicola TaxID=1562124 RepID=A0ABQ1WMV4_9BACT|nr:hypothetical protein GCM10011378_08020 [Hymenobacter glacieicola]
MGLTPLLAAQAPKVFQLNRQLGAGTVVKMLVIILRAFVDSLKVPTKPDAADIIEMADTLAQTYTHDSLKDLILALKDMRTAGTKFYQSVDVATIYAGINTYFDKKAKALENQHYDQKALGASGQAVAVAALDLSPDTQQILKNVASTLPDTHPLKDTLRRRLRISKARLHRGTITEEQHEQTLAENRKLTIRKDRADWKPSPEGQKQMDKRHRAEDRRLEEKYRRPAA